MDQYYKVKLFIKLDIECSKCPISFDSYKRGFHPITISIIVVLKNTDFRIDNKPFPVTHDRQKDRMNLQKYSSQGQSSAFYVSPYLCNKFHFSFSEVGTM